MLVIVKGLLSGYNIDPSTIHKAWNSKVLRLFENAAYLDLFLFVQYAFFFDHNTSTMAFAGLTHGELVPNMVGQ